MIALDATPASLNSMDTFSDRTQVIERRFVPEDSISRPLNALFHEALRRGDVSNASGESPAGLTGVEMAAMLPTLAFAADPVSRTEKAQRTRVELLARKYARNTAFEPEELARFEIATTRLDAIAPRVTPEDRQMLSDFSGRLDSLDKELTEIDELLDG